jgi:hypothetical protein
MGENQFQSVKTNLLISKQKALQVSERHEFNARE